MRVTLYLQNVRAEGCVQNIKVALQVLDGVKAVLAKRAGRTADILYESPATRFQMRGQLHKAGYSTRTERRFNNEKD